MDNKDQLERQLADTAALTDEKISDEAILRNAEISNLGALIHGRWIPVEAERDFVLTFARLQIAAGEVGSTNELRQAVNVMLENQTSINCSEVDGERLVELTVCADDFEAVRSLLAATAQPVQAQPTEYQRGLADGWKLGLHADHQGLAAIQAQPVAIKQLEPVTTDEILQWLDEADRKIPASLASATITATPLQLAYVAGKIAQCAAPATQGAQPKDQVAASASLSSEQHGLSWVSVKDRLPEEGVNVLVYRPLAHETHDPLYTIDHRISYARRSPQDETHFFSRWCHPTHWMPLPPAPTASDSPSADPEAQKPAAPNDVSQGAQPVSDMSTDYTYPEDMSKNPGKLDISVQPVSDEQIEDLRHKYNWLYCEKRKESMAGGDAERFAMRVVVDEVCALLAAQPHPSQPVDRDSIIEECAKVCEELKSWRPDGYRETAHWGAGTKDCAAAIRALKQQEPAPQDAPRMRLNVERGPKAVPVDAPQQEPVVQTTIADVLTALKGIGFVVGADDEQAPFRTVTVSHDTLRRLFDHVRNKYAAPVRKEEE